MGRLIGRRLLFLLPVLFGILVAVFVTMRIVPGIPPVSWPARRRARGARTIRHQFRPRQPLHVQFERYLLDVCEASSGGR